MLHLTQLLTFEIGKRCNFEQKHKELCPITHMTRGRNREITDEMIIYSSIKAYDRLGFEGFISWHFYNEPMIYWQRMLHLMTEIKGLIPQSRFFLWTNGSILIQDERMKLFDVTMVSNYLNKSQEELSQYFHNPLVKPGGQQLDDRLVHYGDPDHKPCTIMFDNFLIANDGEVYICCHDWRNKVKIGNLFDSDLEVLDARRWKYAKQICGKQMTAEADPACLYCNAKWDVAGFDESIRQKALQQIALLV